MKCNPFTSSGVICAGVIYDELLRLREEVAELKRKDNINALNYAIAGDTVKRLRVLCQHNAKLLRHYVSGRHECVLPPAISEALDCLDKEGEE